MNITESTVIGQLVAENYRSAEVFSKYGIDFCCKGDQAIKDVCAKKKLNVTELIDALNSALSVKETLVSDYKSWPSDLLADYIEKKHHRYVAEKTPVIQKYLHKVSSVHGAMHPELLEIAESFNACAEQLAMHMKKEELILFPFIRKMTVTGTLPEMTRFGSVENPIEMMKEEHTTEGERFRRISELSNHYTPPADACNTYRVTYAMLKEFEEDLHLHIHLENNILFPSAIKMEQDLMPSSCSI